MRSHLLASFVWIAAVSLFCCGGAGLASAQVTDLQAALDNAVPGDVIEFSGTHFGSFETRRNGTAANPITIRGVGGNAVIQGFGNNNNSNRRGLEVFHDHYRIENFAIQDFIKGIWVENADHGILRNLTVQNIGNEAFKFRDFSNYWLVEDCTAINTGTLGIFGEGFYVGDADNNWEDINQPDTSGFITFLNCYTSETGNDGYDVKEGSHHVKFINCVADFTQRNPFADPNTGDAGFYVRADCIQLIDCTVIGLDGGQGTRPPSGFRLFEETVNGQVFGRNFEMAGIATLMMGPDNAAVHLHRRSVAYSSILYDDYSLPGLLYQDDRRGLELPADLFVEKTWDGIGGQQFRGFVVLLGDVNLDEEVSFFDIAPFIALLTSGDYQDEADMNQDGAVDFRDIAPFILAFTLQ